MENDEGIFLNQLINALMESEEQLEKANAGKDYESFNKSKKVMFMIQKEIADVLK
jgi:hypothetical protein